MSRLIETKDLTHLREGELLALYRALTYELGQSEPHQPAHRYALASLENIRRELNRRKAITWRSGPSL